MSDNNSLKQIMKFRLEKLNKLREDGVEPYPVKYEPSHISSEIKLNYKKFENKHAKIAGRLMIIRRMGKASFAQLMDCGGKIQIFVKRDDIGDENYAQFKLLDIGDFVGVEGEVFTTKTGEISIRVSVLTILAKSIRPLPVVKEKDGELFDSFTDKEQRYRNRHLDLILNPEVRETFIKRSSIIKTIRRFLDERNFLEVETPILQPIYGGANARPFITHHNALNQNFYLRIADELYLKRLIIGGLDRVYEISKDFRNEGIDRNHNPEFTMLEFYCSYFDYYDCMKLVEKLIQDVAKEIDCTNIQIEKNKIDLVKPFKVASFYNLLKDKTGYDMEGLNDLEVKKICEELEFKVEIGAGLAKMLDDLMSQLVEPCLIEPTFVVDYPKIISPLAKLHRNGNQNIVERFELFIGGLEFANSFSELNDPVDQRKRFEEQSKFINAGYKEAHPIDENFLQALECGMPPTGGVGLGIDRLTMLLTENRWIKDVILFPTLKTDTG